MVLYEKGHKMCCLEIISYKLAHDGYFYLEQSTRDMVKSVRNSDIVGIGDVVGNGDINFVTPLS